MLERTCARIDRRSPVPFYFQLRQLIRDEIAAGRWEPGERIPSENELCRHFGVSRTTVRQALSELESEGLLHKEKGRGSFVAEPRSSSWFLQSSHGFHDEATRAGRTVTSRVLRRELEETVLETELEHGSLYGALLAQRGVEVSGGRRVVEATTARDELAEVLEIEPGAPVLMVQAVSWDADLRPFECYRAWHRSDRTTIEVQVVGQRAAETAGLDPTNLRIPAR